MIAYERRVRSSLSPPKARQTVKRFEWDGVESILSLRLPSDHDRTEIVTRTEVQVFKWSWDGRWKRKRFIRIHESHLLLRLQTKEEGQVSH